MPQTRTSPPGLPSPTPRKRSFNTRDKIAPFHRRLAGIQANLTASPVHSGRDQHITRNFLHISGSKVPGEYLGPNLHLQFSFPRPIPALLHSAKFSALVRVGTFGLETPPTHSQSKSERTSDYSNFSGRRFH
jgi:hypothetical protein